MRSILWATMLLIFIAGLIITDTIIIRNMAFEMSAALEAMLEAEEPYAEVEECFEVWEKFSHALHFLIDHTEIDKVSVGIERMRELDGEELLAEAVGLKFYIDHMPERERFALQNIF